MIFGRKSLPAVAALLLLAACGGSTAAQSPSPAPTPAISKAEATALATKTVTDIFAGLKGGDLNALSTVMTDAALMHARGDITARQVSGAGPDYSALAVATATAYETKPGVWPAFVVASVPVHDAKSGSDSVISALFSKGSERANWMVLAFVTSEGKESAFKPALDKAGYLQLADPSPITEGATSLVSYLTEGTNNGPTADPNVTPSTALAQVPVSSHVLLTSAKSAGYVLSIKYSSGGPDIGNVAFKGDGGSVLGFARVGQTTDVAQQLGNCFVQDTAGHYFSPALAAGRYKQVQVVNDIEYLASVSGSKVTVLAHDFSTSRLNYTAC